MHELQRRAYLDAMGIATYISRAALQGAAPSVKLARKPRPASSHSEPLPQSQPAHRGAPAMPRIELAASARKSSAAESTKTPGAPTAAAAVEFSVVAIRTGNWLWVEELPAQQPLMRDQVLLIQAMARALGWSREKPTVWQFHWPIHTNAQLDLGEQAARAGLAGFINRKLEGEGAWSLVVLGSPCQRWLAVEQLGAQGLVNTVDTVQMLQQPTLKKQAWRDLLPYAS